MKEYEVSYKYIDKDNYYLVLFKVDEVDFYALVDKETCEPFVIKTLTYGFTDRFSYNADDDYKKYSNYMSVNYYPIYLDIKSYFLSLNENNFILGIPSEEGYYIVKEDEQFIKMIITKEKINKLKENNNNLLYAFLLNK